MEKHSKRNPGPFVSAVSAVAALTLVSTALMSGPSYGSTLNEPLSMKIEITQEDFDYGFKFFKLPIEFDPEDAPCDVDLTVDWGEGGSPQTISSDGTSPSSNPSHGYSSHGTFTVSAILGDLHTCPLRSSYHSEAIIEVITWGGRDSSGDWLTSLDFAFDGLRKLVSVPTSLPQTVRSLRGTFSDARTFNQDISSWNVSNVTDMSRMFSDAYAFNQDISTWDVSNVTDMSRMFSDARAFNQEIGRWDVSLVEDFSSMFGDAYVFNGDVSRWDTSSALDFRRVFSGAEAFNQDISAWDVSNVTNMSGMFSGAYAFNQDISSWEVSNVVSMSGMFRYSGAFNQDISSWDVSNVFDMTEMFEGASSFSQDLDTWDTSSVSDFQNMFRDSVFNGKIESWDTSSALIMDGMFAGATLFNQDISRWDTSGVTDMDYMFEGAVSFNQPIFVWDIGAVEDFSDFLLASEPSAFGYCLPWEGNEDFDYRVATNQFFAPGYDHDNCVEITLETQGGDPYPAFEYQASGFELPQPRSATKQGDVFEGWSIEASSCEIEEFPYASPLASPLTFFAVWESSCAPDVSTPSIPTYSGPVVTSIGGGQGSVRATHGEEVAIELRNGVGISQVMLGQLPADLISVTSKTLVIRIPVSAQLGLQDLILIGEHGRLLVQGAFEIFESDQSQIAEVTGCIDSRPQAWTKRISSGEAKVYIKCGEIGTSYRIQVQDAATGEYRTVITRTLASEDDDRQVFNDNGRYLIRTLEIKDRLRIRVLAGDDIVRQNVYNQ